MPSPFLYFVGGGLSQAELSSACLDGHLIELGEGYIPADMTDSAALRAASLADLLGETLAATHESAAWVWGRLEEPPARHRVQRAVERRLHHVVSRRLVYRDPLIDADDVCEIAGVRVSTPVRTLVDLARSTEASSHELARAWGRAAPDDAERAQEWFEQHRGIPRKRLARALLADLRTT
ncbi:type IV toxin-antitoxin system AbiEi family antitoxin [Microbacterium sp. P07]|uniref:type IV toxin-antitoxin system AbiEi family antitoxin n=1 Tax=Microbacterium sp. P07 TaxID=3366952 RepID=UPI0037472E37